MLLHAFFVYMYIWLCFSFCTRFAYPLYDVMKRDENHWEKGDHLGTRFDLCTVYGHIPGILDINCCA